tara:strand:- start:312 stop:923 length:612 start_codon:yes stop_codon:yes gene_type:complete
MKKLKDNINWDNWLIRRKFKPDYIFTNTLKKILDEFEKEKDYKEYNVLEIGCGHGIGTYPLSEIFKHVDAIDPTKKLLDDLDKRIKNDKKTNIKTYLTTCSKFKTKKKYDLIICKWSFIFTNQEKCFKNIMKLLKKNRYLMIIEPYHPFDIFKQKKRYKKIFHLDQRSLIFKTFELLSKEKKLDKLFLDRLDNSGFWILSKKK